MTLCEWLGLRIAEWTSQKQKEGQVAAQPDLALLEAAIREARGLAPLARKAPPRHRTSAQTVKPALIHKEADHG